MTDTSAHSLFAHKRGINRKFRNWCRGVLHRDGSDYFLRHMGVEICIDSGRFSNQVINSIKGGSYEKREATLALSLLEPGDTVLEIGAGCGFLSTLMAMHPYSRAVHAVEGNPELIPFIKTTYLKNKVDVMLYNEVLGDSYGEVEFWLNDNFPASGLSKALGNRSVKVKQVAFQARLNEIRPNMIVCDIEGGEAHLFRDVDLVHTSKLLFELHENIIGPDGIGTVFDEMAKRGFVYSSAHSSGAVVAFSRNKRTITSGHAHPAAKCDLVASAARSKQAGKPKVLHQRVKWKSTLTKHLQAAHEEFLWIASGQKASSNTKALGINKAFFINLNSRPDRLYHMTDLLKPCPWQYERVEAVRIQTNPEALGLRLIPQLQNRPHVLSIWLSHRKALETALDADGDGPFVVLEDDVRIREDFFKRPLQFRPGIEKDWEVLMLSPRYRKPFPAATTGQVVAPLTRKPFGYSPVRLKDARKTFICTGAHFCIFRNKNTIRSILSRMDKIVEKYHVDHFYILETISYGIHFDSVGTAGLGSDQNEHSALVQP